MAVSAHTTIDVPCAAVANRTFDVAQLAAADGSVLVLQGCAWLNTEVRIVFSRPVVFVFRGVTMVGGIVVFQRHDTEGRLAVGGGGQQRERLH